MKKISLFLVSLLFVSSTAYAFAPAIIWIGRTIATVAVESIVVEGVTRGFSAIDPYVKNRITVPTKNIPAAFKKTKGWLNPYWATFAITAGLLLEDDGFKIMKDVKDHLYQVGAYTELGGVTCPTVTKAFGYQCLSVTGVGSPDTDRVFGCGFAAPWGLLPCYSSARVGFTYAQPDGTVNNGQLYAFVSVDPVVVGKEKSPISDLALASMAAAYLASDNRPADAFMDVSSLNDRLETPISDAYTFLGNVTIFAFKNECKSAKIQLL